VKVAVAGGTGFLGRHISAALIATGHEVTVMTRDPGKAANIGALKGARAVRGDVTVPASLRGVFDGIEAVVGCVQFPNHPIEVPRRDLTYETHDHIGTRNLLAEAKRAGVRRYFYVSGAGADPASDKTWYRAKGRAEVAVHESGLDHCILRPSWAYGPEDRALNRLALIARFSPVVPRLGMKPQWIQPVFVDDIADAVVSAFEHDDAWGRTFEIGGPDEMTMDQVIRTLLSVLRLRRVVLPIPATLAKIGTAPLVLLPAPPMTPSGIEFAIQDGLVDMSETTTILGIKPMTLRAGLSTYIQR
jgi:uncharacterized protein YbjT (DUF2867 family)